MKKLLYALKDILHETSHPSVQEHSGRTSNPGASNRVSILLIDASGSMEEQDYPPSRLGAAKKAAQNFVERLAQEDPIANIAVVSYSDQSQMEVELTAASNQKYICQKINQIHTQSFTNITSALVMSLNILGQNHANNQVVLLSDGYHNEGNNPLQAAKELKKCAIIECIGIGGSPKEVDADLLRNIASAYPNGSKRYHWIGDTQKLVQHFHHLAGRLVRA